MRFRDLVGSPHKAALLAAIILSGALRATPGWTQAVDVSAHQKSAAAAPATNVSSAVVVDSSTLEKALAQFTNSSRHLPFKTVIQTTTGHRVLNYDTNDAAHIELRKKIMQAAAMAGERAKSVGLEASRPNEAGNRLEPFVRAALRDAGLNTRVPLNVGGRAQVTGYPDIEITGSVSCYLELKTYNAATVNTTQRTFYYSPSTQTKVTHDALHLLLAYELQKVTREGKTVFVPKHWKLLTIEDLEVDLKFEFNQSNRGLYGSGRALLDEDIPK